MALGKDSKLSPSLFSVYLADMPRPTELVTWIYHAYNITVWAPGVQTPGAQRQHLFDGDVPFRTGQFAISTKVISNLVHARPSASQYPPEDQDRWFRTSPRPQPKDTRSVSTSFFSFNTHCIQVANRVSKINTIFMALAGTGWGQQSKTLMRTYKAV